MSDFPILSLQNTWPERPPTDTNWTPAQFNAFFTFVKDYINKQTSLQWLKDAKNEIASKWNRSGFLKFAGESATFTGSNDEKLKAMLLDAFAAELEKITAPHKVEIESAIDARLKALGVDPAAAIKTKQLIPGLDNTTLYIIGGVVLGLILIVVIIAIASSASRKNNMNYNMPYGPPMQQGYFNAVPPPPPYGY